MKTLKLSAVAVLFLLATFSGNAAADLINLGTYSQDTVSGLDWLHLTESNNRSWTYIDTQFGTGGEFEGWRYATGAEFDQMILNAGGGAAATEWAEVYTAEFVIGLLENHFGVLDYLTTSLDPNRYPISGGILGDLFESPAGYRHFAQLFQLMPGSAIFPNAENYGAIAWGYQVIPGDGAYEGYGSFLVRNGVNPVPEPATLLLLGAGLVGVAGFGRKKLGRT